MALRRMSESLRQAIIEESAQLGINPTDLATVIAYETGGTFDPWKKGPRTRWGTHRGLIQWGEPQARRYGVYQGMSDRDQLQAVGRYLRDAGVKPGMGILDIYSAVNAGRVGLYNRSDRPGYTVSRHVRQMTNTLMPEVSQMLGVPGTAGGQSGPDQNTIRLAQEALRAQGYDVPLSGSLDSATTAALGEFRASPGGMAFAQAYGLPVRPPAQPAAYAPADQQAPAVQAVNAMAQGGQPPPRFRVAQVNAQGQTMQPDAITPGPGVEVVRPGSEYLDARPNRSAPGAYRVDAQPYRGMPVGTDPGTLLQPAAGNGVRRVQIARLDENGNPVQPPDPRPPVQMQIGPGQQATLPSLMPQPAAAAPMDTGRFDAGAPAPSRFDIADPMARDLQFDPIAPRHLTDTWQNEPMIPPGQGYIGPNGQVTTREYRWNGLANQATTPDNQGGPGRMNNLGVPTGPAPRPTTAPLPSLAEYADPNGALMISAQVPPVNPIQQFMADQAEQYRQQDRAAGIPVMPPLPPADVPSVLVPEGQVPFPRPNPIPVAQRGRAGRTPNGYQWSHIPQRGGPTMLAVVTPQGRRWSTPLGPPGGAGLFNEFASSFTPVIRG